MERTRVPALGSFLGLLSVSLFLAFPRFAFADPPQPASDAGEVIPDKPAPTFWDRINPPEEPSWDQTGQDSQSPDPSGVNNTNLGGLNAFNNFGGFGGTGGIGGLGGFGMGGFGMGIPRNPLASYGATWYPSEPVSGQSTHLSAVKQNLSVMMPAWRNETDAVAITTNVRSTLFQTDAVFPNPSQPFPSELWNINLGVNYSHMFDNGWMGMVMASVGSASDKPFQNLSDVNGSVSAFLRVPSGERNSWMFGLSYAPTGELPYPIPMAAYQWRPTDNFMMNIGLPFMIMWRPWEDVFVNLSYVPVRTINSRVSWRITRKFNAFTGFSWSNEASYLSDRPTLNDRLLYYEKRVSMGVQYLFTPKIMMELSGGYAFDRFYFIGVQYTDRNNDRIDIGNGAFVSLQFRWIF